MRVCVFGVGSVGGYLAARLLKAGVAKVSVVARGEQLRAIRENGLQLLAPGEEFVVHPHRATEDACTLPPQDFVFVTLKSQSQSAAAASIAATLAHHGTAIFANNGIPWWWKYRGTGTGDPLPLLDPEAALWRQVQPGRVLGCVIYSANEVIRPGVVRHTANNHWLLGEPDEMPSKRLTAAVSLIRAAGLNAEAVDDIRRRVWTKLLRNTALNSLCALTRLPVNALSSTPGMSTLFAAVVNEVVAIAAADGVDLSGHLETARAALAQGAAIDGTRAASIRPSMLQDVLLGRGLEVEAILGQVQAIARESGTPCPKLDILVPLMRALDASTRC